jgi:hypothetical protein
VKCVIHTNLNEPNHLEAIKASKTRPKKQKKKDVLLMPTELQKHTIIQCISGHKKGIVS